ncbi:DUF3794 domain-containing protein [Paraclostridium sordellii]|uniref:Cna B-type domain-containing protein n=1 Tax=Paraclostridium sordellii TaxID=1505 RepID=A0A0C7QTP0_PARSO|nr:DUF3794 domain-containing protein [Paeniclostridium sordellii]CEN22063.1 Cna B-type domain-containing protein [[Clostridium] sordellii] [Paeniclostridium sordellii]CEN78906.1 Cna B-type domain-containing protein [[Clostridium] sordellii] [Paeniclostridium sordellii]CEP40100.1 Cna B-type domain-containing protein [[Clostridium] sordellii] [Paeniclostridium sordellii]CEP96060.1 Cna B-type domain-containing protein [[Clostridium] sordellii] [Paeniclostridium sordellii]CEQ01886.1 Cna B-type dom
MLNFDYTANTAYKFYNKCCSENDYINTVGVYPENKIEKVLSCFNDTDKWTEFFIPEIVDIPIQKPDIEGLVEVHSCVDIISQRVIKTPTVSGYTTTGGTLIPGETIGNGECTNLTGRKLIIEGLLKQKIIYTSLTDEQSLHSAHFTIPFSTFIIIEKDTPLSQKFRITPYIEDIFACSLSERSVFKNTTIFIKASKIC